MTPRSKKTAAALSGALVLASGAYALGSQSGDGAALAGSTTQSARLAGPGPGGPGHRLADMADRLGVTEAKLRAALEDARPNRRAHDERHAALAKALAGELGLAAEKVETALENRHGQRKLRRDDRRGDHHEAFAEALAQKLDVSEAKVRSALEELRPDGRRGGPPDLGALAGKLGVSEAKLRTALEEARPGPRRMHRRGPGGPHGAGIATLAKDLGVPEAKLTAALEKVRGDLDAEMQAERDAFTAELAQKLGVPEAKVKEVFAPGPHHGRRGP